MLNPFEMPKRLRSANHKIERLEYNLKTIHKDYSSDIEKIVENHRIEKNLLITENRNLAEKNTKLTQKLSAYQEREEKYLDVAKRETQIEIREDELEVAANLLDVQKDKLDSKIKAAQKENDARVAKLEEKAETDGKAQYKNGYGDGVADGLRKAHEITAEDRRMAMQVAGLAAASHSTEASQKLAEGFTEPALKSLGDGKSSANK